MEHLQQCSSFLICSLNIGNTLKHFFPTRHIKNKQQILVEWQNARQVLLQRGWVLFMWQVGLNLSVSISEIGAHFYSAAASLTQRQMECQVSSCGA
jgi:hypothetical protein